MTEPARKLVLDNLKALGIVLVVVGHAPGMPVWLIALIYSFHMPLFFFLSGYLLNRNRLQQESWRDWFWRSGRTLMVPFLVFYLVSWGYQLAAAVARRQSLAGLADTTPVWGWLTGTSASMPVNLVLWFFPALLLTSTVFRGLSRQLEAARVWVVTTVLAVVWLYLSPRLEVRWVWSADCVPMALCFYGWGYAIAPQGERVERLFRVHAHPLWGILWLGGLLGLVTLNGRVDLNGLGWGQWPLLYLPTACWGIGGLWWCSARMPASRWATWLARNSLVIFPMHPLFFSGITGVGMLILHLPEDFQHTSPGVGLVYVALALLLSYPAAWLLRPLLSR